MLTIGQVCDFLEAFAPSSLAESWDNVGLLVGNRSRTVSQVMTCLTITPASAAEAILAGAQLIVSHHPLPFRPLNRITTGTTEGRILLDLIAAGVAIYSPHTAFDSTLGGINQKLSEGLGLLDIKPLLPSPDAAVGGGRFGRLPAPPTLAQLAETAKGFLKIDHLQLVGSPQSVVSIVAIGCGSAGEFMEPSLAAGCDCFLTGEARFHTCLEADAIGLGMILVGHFASERFGVEHLARVLAGEFPQLKVWASCNEQDPLTWL